MRRLTLGFAGLVLLVLGASVVAGQDTTSLLSVFLTRLRNGQIGFAGTSPTCDAGCGSSPTIAGTDSFFTVTMGTGPASPYTFTFARTWTAAPACVGVTAKTAMVSGKIPMNLQTSTTQLVVTNLSASPVATDQYAFHCGGVQ